jgi:pyridoxamine 5'-phosphate oxidase
VIEPDAGVSPLQLLASWWEAARQAEEPMAEAATLATITPDGWPSARMVIVRGLDRGLLFFTDRESGKGADLAANPRAALVLHWLAPEHRQVRVVGHVEPAGDQAADDYWNSRRPGARRSAAASVQSRVIASRAQLERGVEELERRFPDGVDLPRPLRWVGYRVVPIAMEFWQEAPDGLHHRFRYRRDGSTWEVARLAP